MKNGAPHSSRARAKTKVVTPRGAAPALTQQAKDRQLHAHLRHRLKGRVVEEQCLNGSATLAMAFPASHRHAD
jgi:hypothetical protein